LTFWVFAQSSGSDPEEAILLYNMYMNEAKEEVRARLAIEDVIGEYVQLKRAGRYWRGLSPFTNEKTPSFFVTPERDIWHDFSSGKGGDIFTFIMEVEGLDFRSALEHLARKAGIDLSLYDNRTPRQLTSRKNRIYEMNRLALNYFQHEMLKSKVAQDYIARSRHLSRETVIEWGIGFAPDRPDLKKLLKSRQFDDNEIRGAGLMGPRGGEMFRCRMMIPLRDSQGQVVGFTGRIIGSGEPKYLNTPATVLYDKSRQVFGLNFAKQAIRQADEAVLVEGNLDVISSHQAGISNVVACAGTALTRDHLKAIWRLTHNLKLSFDGDKAGLAATERAIILAEALDIKLSVINLPNGAKDPDELIQKSPNQWSKAIKTAVPAVEWVIQKYAAEQNLETAEGKKTLTTQALRLVRNLHDAVEREFYLDQLSQMTGISLGSLEQKMSSAGQGNHKTERRIKPTKIARRDVSRQSEQYFLTEILAIAFSQPRLRSVIKNLPDTYLTEVFGKVKYFLLGEKIAMTPELADKLAELELVASQEPASDIDDRLLLLGFMRDLELLKLRARFEQLSHELAMALDNDDDERTKLLNGAVNGVKRDLNRLEKTSARDDFAGLFTIWDDRKG
jgi:DNA primase